MSDIENELMLRLVIKRLDDIDTKLDTTLENMRTFQVRERLIAGAIAILVSLGVTRLAR